MRNTKNNVNDNSTANTLNRVEKHADAICIQFE